MQFLIMNHNPVRNIVNLSIANLLYIKMEITSIPDKVSIAITIVTSNFGWG